MREPEYIDFIPTDENEDNPDFRAWRLSRISSGRIGSYCIDFDRYPMPDELKTLAMQILSLKLKELNYSPHNPVSVSFMLFSRNLLLVLCIVHKFFLDRKISSLQKFEILDLYGFCLLFEVNATIRRGPRKPYAVSRRPKPRSKSMLEGFVTLNKWLHKTYQTGLILDGPEYRINSSALLNHLTQIMVHSDINVTDWAQEGSHGSIPFVIANLLLVDAIEIINSEKCKQVLAYFNVFRSAKLPGAAKILWAFHDNRPKRFRNTTDEHILFNRSAREEQDTYECVDKVLAPLHQALKEISGDNYSFPWATYRKFITDYNQIITAAYVIFLSLLGKRGPSEILTLRACDVSLTNEINQGTIRAANHKSHGGARITQGVSSFITDAYNTLIRCSYIEKEGTDLPIFSTLPLINNIYKQQREISSGYSVDLLQKYYEDFIARASNKVDFCIRTLHPNIGSHQFRHTFAEYALRRFDGNVEELLRQVFQHGSNHWWIKRYTADKLDDETAQRLNREYIQELIPRALRDIESDEQDFVGGMAIFIKTNIAPKAHHLTPKEFEKYVVDLSDQFTLTPHEYGWCMLLSEYSNQARCTIDGINPFPQGTDCEKCNKCMHFMASRSSHLSTQKMIAISHIDFLECGFWESALLREASIQAIKNAQRLFPELRELGEF
jgi:integrase